MVSGLYNAARGKGSLAVAEVCFMAPVVTITMPSLTIGAALRCARRTIKHAMTSAIRTMTIATAEATMAVVTIELVEPSAPSASAVIAVVVDVNSVGGGGGEGDGGGGGEGSSG